MTEMMNLLSNEERNLVMCAEQCATSPLEVRRDKNRFPRIAQSTRGEARKVMAALIGEASMLLGRRLDEEQARTMAGALCEEIRNDQSGRCLRSLAWVEISRAFHRAVMTKEVYAFSVKFLYDALLDYVDGTLTQLQDQIRKEEATELIRRREELSKNITESYARMMLKAQQEREAAEAEIRNQSTTKNI